LNKPLEVIIIENESNVPIVEKNDIIDTNEVNVFNVLTEEINPADIFDEEDFVKNQKRRKIEDSIKKNLSNKTKILGLFLSQEKIKEKISITYKDKIFETEKYKNSKGSFDYFFKNIFRNFEYNIEELKDFISFKKNQISDFLKLTENNKITKNSMKTLDFENIDILIERSKNSSLKSNINNPLTRMDIFLNDNNLINWFCINFFYYFLYEKINKLLLKKKKIFFYKENVTSEIDLKDKNNIDVFTKEGVINLNNIYADEFYWKILISYFSLLNIFRKVFSSDENGDGNEIDYENLFDYFYIKNKILDLEGFFVIKNIMKEKDKKKRKK